MNLKRILWPAALASLVFVRASADPSLNSEKLPLSWYSKPEDAPAVEWSALAQSPAFADLVADSRSTATGSTEAATDFDQPGEEAGSVLERALRAPLAVMDRVSAASSAVSTPPPSPPPSPPPGRPKDWVPWRMTFFSTELSVSAQGLLGLLTARGTPQVIAMWRKQGPLPATTPVAPQVLNLASSATLASASERPTEPSPAVAAPEPGVIPLGASDSAEDLLKQMEPSVRAGVAAGSLREGPELRKNLHGIARRLQEMVQALESVEYPGTQWWVAGCRFDLILDVSGRLGLAGPTGGVETRLRFDWRRLQRNGHAPRWRAPLGEVGSNLQRFMVMVAQDLDQAADGALKNSGYQAFTYRLGFGVNVRGSIGLVTGGSQMFGQLMFNHEAKRPEVRPPLKSVQELPDHYVMLERNAPAAHVSAAASFGIPVERISASETQYSVARTRLRKGLRKSLKIASYFVRHARASSRPQSDGWKIYIMRLLYDWSLTGNAGLVAVGGQPSAEIFLYNENF